MGRILLHGRSRTWGSVGGGCDEHGHPLEWPGLAVRMSTDRRGAIWLLSVHSEHADGRDYVGTVAMPAPTDQQRTSRVVAIAGVPGTRIWHVFARQHTTLHDARAVLKLSVDRHWGVSGLHPGESATQWWPPGVGYQHAAGLGNAAISLSGLGRIIEYSAQATGAGNGRITIFDGFGGTFPDIVIPPNGTFHGQPERLNAAAINFTPNIRTHFVSWEA